MAAITKSTHEPTLEPFYFNTSAHLLRITDFVAGTPAELLDALQKCPEDSISQHTFRTLEEHHFLAGGFSNDFAHWASTECNEPRLAEVLAGIDVREFTSIARLREKLVKILETFLAADSRVRNKKAAEAFHFCSSDLVILPTRFRAQTVHEFAEALQRVGLHSIHHHFIEARLRLKLMSNDFSRWLRDSAGLPETADALNRIDIYSASLEEVRQQIVGTVNRALT